MQSVSVSWNQFSWLLDLILIRWIQNNYRFNLEFESNWGCVACMCHPQIPFEWCPGSPFIAPCYWDIHRPIHHPVLLRHSPPHSSPHAIEAFTAPFIAPRYWDIHRLIHRPMLLKHSPPHSSPHVIETFIPSFIPPCYWDIHRLINPSLCWPSFIKSLSEVLLAAFVSSTATLLTLIVLILFLRR